MASRVVLITGANSGVGYATAKVLADAPEKFHVIMSGRTLSKVETAKSEIESSGINGSLSVVQLDVLDDGSIERAAQHIQDTHGHLDVLINNAALGTLDPDLRKCLQTCFTTNVVGPALVSQALRPLLLKSPNPYSIYVSSGAGSLTRAGQGAAAFKNEEGYRVSKAALNMLAVLEKRDHGLEGLKVFALCPGFVVSNLRGTSEESRTGGGKAGDPMVSGQTILSVLRGERDKDVGLLVNKDGVYPW